MFGNKLKGLFIAISFKIRHALQNMSNSRVKIRVVRKEPGRYPIFECSSTNPFSNHLC
jgi:hypothetical protein